MFGFNVIEPVESTLTESNLEDDTPPWSMTGSFDEGYVVGHATRRWESLADANEGHEPGADGSEAYWLDLGADNLNAMFDETIQSQSVGDGPIEVERTLAAGVRADALFVQNLDALEVTATVRDGEGELLSEETQSLADYSGITNIWRYLFNRLRWRTWALFSLPNNAGASIRLLIDNGDADARCGDCVIGRAAMLGTTQFGGEVGMIDFSSKERTAFGQFRWVERGWADTGSFQVWVRRVDLDDVVRVLREGRASRRVYVAFDGHGATIINGVWQDWRIVLTTPTHYVLNIPLESLA